MKVHCLSLDPASVETAERKRKDKEEFHLSVPLRGENQHNHPRQLQTHLRRGEHRPLQHGRDPLWVSKTQQNVVLVGAPVSSNPHPRRTDMALPPAGRTTAPAPHQGEPLSCQEEAEPPPVPNCSSGQPKDISYTKQSPQACQSESWSQRCS